MTKRSHILGTGSALPADCVSNAALIDRYQLDSSDDWIFSRTGITQRYLCGPGENTATLATGAARQALQASGLSPADVDLIVVATCSPDAAFPAVAMHVQRELGTRPIPAFDINAACSGFIYALNVADSLLHSGSGQTALVIGAERFSGLLDWQDRSTCVLFGDGAGAVVLRLQEGDAGLFGSRIFADGQGTTALYADDTTGPIHMNGREVFKHAVRTMGHIDEAWLGNYGATLAGLEWMIPHQANSRILSSAAEAAGIPAEKVVQTVGMHANTSAASIPLALDTAVRDWRIQPGQWIYLQSFGAGFTWGEALLKL